MAIVILTSAGALVDRLVALEMGADDPQALRPARAIGTRRKQAKGARVAYFSLDSARNIRCWPLNFCGIGSGHDGMCAFWFLIG